ncbi:hypothetical protein WA158_006203 [Blastocystis sp. Blastoise]
MPQTLNGFNVITQLPPASWSLKSIFQDTKPYINQDDLLKLGDMCLLRIPEEPEERQKLVTHVNSVLTAASSIKECLCAMPNRQQFSYYDNNMDIIHNCPEAEDHAEIPLNHKDAMKLASKTTDGYYIAPSPDAFQVSE